jgi:hypothetical protein
VNYCPLAPHCIVSPRRSFIDTLSSWISKNGVKLGPNNQKMAGILP